VLIERKYVLKQDADDGHDVHIITIPVWCPLPNDDQWCQDHRDRKGRSFKWRIYKQKELTREVVKNTMLWALPEWTVDQTHAAKAAGRAKALRKTISRVHFTRVSPGYGDSKNAEKSSKFLEDAFAGWVEEGYFFSVDHIGDYDGRVIWNQAKGTGWIEWFGGDQVLGAGYGAILELHCNEF
jgi:hypothetical protein